MENTADPNAGNAMRQVTYDRFGDADVLRIETSEIPEPGAEERDAHERLLQRVEAACGGPAVWRRYAPASAEDGGAS